MKYQKEKMTKLSIRIGIVEKEKLTTLCKETGKRKSTIIREIICNGVIKQRLTSEQVKQSLQLIGMANNLNQLTKRLHQLKEIELTSLSAEIRALLNQLIKQFDV